MSTDSLSYVKTPHSSRYNYDEHWQPFPREDTALKWHLNRPTNSNYYEIMRNPLSGNELEHCIANVPAEMLAFLLTFMPVQNCKLDICKNVSLKSKSSFATRCVGAYISSSNVKYLLKLLSLNARILIPALLHQVFPVFAEVTIINCQGVLLHSSRWFLNRFLYKIWQGCPVKKILVGLFC